jgi:NDP-sugar pyrophosphorylase family protein
MVLAAGLATRLRPLTSHRAKGTVPFLNRPLLDYTFDWLSRCGFDRVVVNLHHAGDSLVSLYGSHAYGLEIRYSDEPVLLGTAGGPRAALEHLGERALLINGDVVSTLSIGRLLEHHAARRPMATLALHTGSAAEAYPHVTAAASGRLLGFPGDTVDSDDVAVSGVFSGVHVVERGAIEELPAGRALGIVDPVYRQLMEAGLAVDAIALPGAWYEVGTPELYIEQQLRALRHESLALAFSGYRRDGAGAYASPHAHVENARPRAPYLLAAGCRVKQGAWVEAAVLGEGSQVAAGGLVRRVVLWDGAAVGSGARLEDSIVMKGVSVPPGTVANRTIFTPDGPVSFGADG